MTEYVTGQIYGWNGGECPVHPETEVEVWYRNSASPVVNKAGFWGGSWSHLGFSRDIVCFRVITPHIEPKTIWVNEYKGLCVYGSFSKEVAIENADFDATRVAVKYVEVKE